MDMIKTASANRKKWFKDILKKHKRIAVCGGPNAGKTTLCKLVNDRPVIHTDNLRSRSWEAVPFAVIADVLDVQRDWNTKCDPAFVVEGVQVPRTLRKGLEVDAVVWLNEPLEENSPKQLAMTKGCMTVLAEWYATHKDIPVYQAPPVFVEPDENDGNEA